MDLRSRLRALEAQLGVGQARTVHGSSRPDGGLARSVPISSRPDVGQARSVVDGSRSVSLAERLQRLATTRCDSRAAKPDPGQLPRLLGGEWCAEHVLLVEHTLPLSHRHGRIPLQRINDTSLGFIAGGPEPLRENLLFIDTETTGLSGGTGTVAFLLGLARLRGDRVEIRQYFLSAFAGEVAMLEHALEWFAQGTHLVSFNGKSFDVPLLVTRCMLALRRNPVAGLPHIDLLHRTRTAFKRNWPDCRLQTAEQYLLRLFRDDDVPGHLIPQIWADWLHGGATTQLRGVIDHNRLDVLTLIALAGILGSTYAEPGQQYADSLGIARAHRKAGDAANAVRYLTENDGPLTDDIRLELAGLHARAAAWDKAVPLWQQLAANNSFRAMESLAKYHEHRQRDLATALEWTERMVPLADGKAAESVARRRSRLLRRVTSPVSRTSLR